MEVGSQDVPTSSLLGRWDARVDTQACSDAQWYSFSIAQWANLVCAGKDDSLKHDRNDLTPPNKWEGNHNSSACLRIPHPKCELVSAGTHENRFWTTSMPENWSRSTIQIYNVWKHHTISSSVQMPAARISSKSARALWVTGINAPENVSPFQISLHSIKMTIYWYAFHWF